MVGNHNILTAGLIIQAMLHQPLQKIVLMELNMAGWPKIVNCHAPDTLRELSTSIPEGVE